MNKSDLKLYGLLDELSKLSEDKKRQVAALIVKDDNIISFGVNKLPENINKFEERKSKQLKGFWMEHSERDAIYKAARDGISLNDTEIYVNYFPCCDCARAIICSGIKKIYTPKPDLTHSKWGESWKIATIMFGESDVEVIFVD